MGGIVLDTNVHQTLIAILTSVILIKHALIIQLHAATQLSIIIAMAIHAVQAMIAFHNIV